jgi:putative Mg2+ transporter-C (MgtC) family protein
MPRDEQGRFRVPMRKRRRRDRVLRSHPAAGTSIRLGRSHATATDFRMTLEWTDLVVRLTAAAAAGALLGINRDLSNKPIGARTLGLVSLGAATAAVATIQFPGIAENPDAASRVIQGVLQGIMAGISFIGAGVILRNASEWRVEGLTTAATVWMSAALGIACGFAAWRSATVALVMALILLVVLAWIENALMKNKPDD